MTTQAKVAVIGLGYVGLPLAVEFAKASFHTYGIDIDNREVDTLNAARSYVIDVPESNLASVVLSGKSVSLRVIFMGSFFFHKNLLFNPYKGKEPFLPPLSNFTHKKLHYYGKKHDLIEQALFNFFLPQQ